MDIQTYVKLDEASPELCAKAHNRVRRKLRRWRQEIVRVRIFLEEEGPSRRVPEAACRMVVESDRRPAIAVTGHAGDPERALIDALGRARRALRRQVKRRHARVARQGAELRLQRRMA